MAEGLNIHILFGVHIRYIYFFFILKKKSYVYSAMAKALGCRFFLIYY
jgi:hypothetical protein